MYLLNQITDDPLQTQTIQTPEGYQINLTLYFVQMQAGWFITNLSYLDFTLQGIRVCNSPNLLNQFRNQIPFGLCCISVADREPSLIGDFANSNSQLYILTPDEVQNYVDYINGTG